MAEILSREQFEALPYGEEFDDTLKCTIEALAAAVRKYCQPTCSEEDHRIFVETFNELRKKGWFS